MLLVYLLLACAEPPPQTPHPSDTLPAAGDTGTATDTAVDTGVTPAPVEVSYSDDRLQVVGRVLDDGAGVGLFWPGSAVLLETDAPAVELILEDETGDNYLAVVVDGGSPVVLGGVQGVQRVVLAEGLAAGRHRIELHKRTEGWEGTLWVRGFRLPLGGSLWAVPEPPVRLEFYGDSITSGYSVDCVCDEALPVYKNHYETYAAIATRRLGGQHHSISISGVGLVRSWWQGSMADYWRGIGFSDQDWDFSRWAPDIVVINLGQNDYWLGVSAERMVGAYVDFVAQLRVEHPAAEIFLALGSMDAAAPGSGYPEAVRAAVETLRQGGDQGVHALIFDHVPGGHPVASTQEEMAAVLLAAIEAELGIQAD